MIIHNIRKYWRLATLLAMAASAIFSGGIALNYGSDRYSNGHGVAEGIICFGCLWFTFNWYKLHQGKDW